MVDENPYQIPEVDQSKWVKDVRAQVSNPAQGPEHSSARLERFLQMVDENPYQIPEVDQSKWVKGVRAQV